MDDHYEINLNVYCLITQNKIYNIYAFNYTSNYIFGVLQLRTRCYVKLMQLYAFKPGYEFMKVHFDYEYNKINHDIDVVNISYDLKGEIM